jgi:hypothetical protein
VVGYRTGLVDRPIFSTLTRSARQDRLKRIEGGSGIYLVEMGYNNLIKNRDSHIYLRFICCASCSCLYPFSFCLQLGGENCRTVDIDTTFTLSPFSVVLPPDFRWWHSSHVLVLPYFTLPSGRVLQLQLLRHLTSSRPWCVER